MNERILVVGDEETIREVVCSMLDAAGYECEQAVSGNDALAVLESGRQFDLEVVEIMLTMAQKA
jgi:CheY-like chemotaxis protein